MTTTTRKLRPGQIVRYDGSQAEYAGMLFRVHQRYECDGTCVRDGWVCDLCPSGSPVQYDLSGHVPGQPYDPFGKVVLYFARAKSVMAVSAGH